jgi:DNA-binding GntR family transcriptional regulator
MKILSEKIVEPTLPRHAQVADHIRNGILSGRFLAGSRITERSICEETGASRSSVREAIRQLESEGYLTNIPNRGPVVATLSAQEAADIYQVRGVLEGLAVRNFISFASEEQRQELRASLGELEAAIEEKNVQAQLKAIEHFYETLLQGCYNATLVDLVHMLNARIVRLRATSIRSPGRIRHSLAELKEIAAAIENDDLAAAWEASIRHMEITSAVAQRVIGQQQIKNK